jgi:hypothetical protein
MRAFISWAPQGEKYTEVDVAYDQTITHDKNGYLVMIFNRKDGKGSFHVDMKPSEAKELVKQAAWLRERK